MQGLTICHMQALYRAAGELELDVFVSLYGTRIRSRELHEACCKTMASAT